jgi:hypothetical protein
MKKLLLLLVLLTVSLYSQDDGLDDLPFDDEPLMSKERNYFAIGGGYSIGVLNLNLDNFNKLLKDQFTRSELSKTMIMHGGSAFTGIPFIKNLRLGYHSYGGNLLNESTVGEIKTSEELSVSMSGINFDYGYVPIDNLAIMGGLGIGWGSINFDIAKGAASYDWTKLNDSLVGVDNYFLHAEKSFMYITPTVSVEWAATSFFMMRALVNYNLSFDNPIASADDKSWKINKVAQLDNTPNGLNSNGFYFEFGIFLGLFNY